MCGVSKAKTPRVPKHKNEMVKPISNGFIASRLYDFTHPDPETDACLKEVLKMGSPLGFWAELRLHKALKDEFTRKNQTPGRDYISIETDGRDGEHKNTNSTGVVSLLPSGAKGGSRSSATVSAKTGRTILQQFQVNCKTVDYYVVDSLYLRETGHIRYLVFGGLDLLKAKRHSFTKAELEPFFESIHVPGEPDDMVNHNV